MRMPSIGVLAAAASAFVLPLSLDAKDGFVTNADHGQKDTI